MEFSKECIAFEWNVNFRIWSLASNPILFHIYFIYLFYDGKKKITMELERRNHKNTL